MLPFMWGEFDLFELRKVGFMVGSLESLEALHFTGYRGCTMDKSFSSYVHLLHSLDFMVNPDHKLLQTFTSYVSTLCVH